MYASGLAVALWRMMYISFVLGSAHNTLVHGNQAAACAYRHSEWRLQMPPLLHGWLLAAGPLYICCRTIHVGCFLVTKYGTLRCPVTCTYGVRHAADVLLSCGAVHAVWQRFLFLGCLFWRCIRSWFQQLQQAALQLCACCTRLMFCTTRCCTAIWLPSVALQQANMHFPGGRRGPHWCVAMHAAGRVCDCCADVLMHHACMHAWLLGAWSLQGVSRALLWLTLAPTSSTCNNSSCYRYHWHGAVCDPA